MLIFIEGNSTMWNWSLHFTSARN